MRSLPGWCVPFANWPAGTLTRARRERQLKRLPNVDEIASLTLFLVCDATAITGEMMVIDGGLTHLGTLQLHTGK